MEKWIITADPVLAAEREQKAAASRRVELSPIKDGHTDLWGRLNAADGIALDQALDVIADELPTSVERDHRRAAGLGMMARQLLGQDVLPAQLTHRHGGEPQAVMVGVGACPSGVSAAMAGERLSGARPDHGSGPGFGVGESPAGVLAPGWMFGRPRPPRQAELVLHLDRQSLLDPDTGVVDVEHWGPVLAGQVRELLEGVRVTVRPIIDPDLIPASDSYVVPPTMRFVLEQRHPVDAFPFGTQKSSRCDADHTIPFDHTAPPGHGQTRLGNLAPLSRYVHRLRTHGGWQVEQPAPGTLLWRSPGGFEYLTNPSGSAMVRRPPPPEHRWWQVEPPDPPDPPETVVLPPCHDGDGDASMPPVQPRADGLGQPPKTPPQDSLSWPHAS